MGLGSERSISILLDEYCKKIENLDEFRVSFKQFKENFNSLLSDNKIKLYSQMHSPFSPAFYWYSSSIDHHYSTGEGFKKNRAIIRSIGELYERLPIYFNWENAFRLRDNKFIAVTVNAVDSSNGLSFGLNLHESILRSYKELVERHVVMEYWGNKKPAERITRFNKYKFHSYLYQAQVGMNFRFLHLKNNFGFKVVVCNLFNSSAPPYNIFGYGSDLDIQLAMEKAFLEAWRFYWNYKIKSEGQGSGSEVIRCEDHFEFYCKNKFDPNEVFQEGKCLKIDDAEALKIDDLYFFDLNTRGFSGYSIKVVRDDFHHFYAGALKKNFLKRHVNEVHPIA